MTFPSCDLGLKALYSLQNTQQKCTNIHLLIFLCVEKLRTAVIRNMEYSQVPIPKTIGIFNLPCPQFMTFVLSDMILRPIHLNISSGNHVTSLLIVLPQSDEQQGKVQRKLPSKKSRKDLRRYLDSIPSPSPSIKIQIIGWQVYLR